MALAAGGPEYKLQPAHSLSGKALAAGGLENKLQPAHFLSGKALAAGSPENKLQPAHFLSGKALAAGSPENKLQPAHSLSGKALAAGGPACRPSTTPARREFYAVPTSWPLNYNGGLAGCKPPRVKLCKRTNDFTKNRDGRWAGREPFLSRSAHSRSVLTLFQAQSCSRLPQALGWN